MKFSLKVVTTCLITMSCFAPVLSADITLDFNSLPSDQGWDIVIPTTGSHANDVESEVFSIDSNELTMSTVGDGLISPSGIFYSRAGVVDPTRPWSLEWSVNLTDYQSNQTPQEYGAFFAIYTGSARISVAVGDDGIVYDTAAGTTRIANDNLNAGFQSFVIDYTPDSSNGTYELFLDNALIASESAFASSVANQLAFGDGTGAANADFRLSSYQFQSIPEPGSLVCLGAVGVFLSVRRKR
jgi:hypothetical protein